MKLRRFMNEGLTKDFIHAKDMFLKTVATFKEAKDLDSSTLSVVADMVRFLGKFVEEHNQLKGSADLKDAKELLRKAMDKLDIAAEKFGEPKEKKEKKEKLDDFPVDDETVDTDDEPVEDETIEPVDTDENPFEDAPSKGSKKGSSDPW